MIVLPIVQREILEAARRRSTYWQRVGIAAAGVIISVIVMLIPEFQPPAMLGRALFLPLTAMTLIYCGGVGVFRTADCLSEEKREGTLGLLFLTDLKGYDIVFGKLVATSLSAIYGVLALVPILAIPLLMGGVTLAEFARVVLVAFNTMFFSLAAGMVSSAFCRDERKAMVFAAGIFLAFAFGPLAVVALIENSQVWRNRGLSELAAIPSPIFSAVFAIEDLRQGVPSAAKYFAASVVFIHLVGWLQLIASSFVIPRAFQERAVTPVKGRSQAAVGGARDGTSGGGAVILEATAARIQRRRRRLSINPVYWLVTRGWFRMAVVWGVLGLGGVIWLFGVVLEPQDWLEEEFYVITALMAHTFIRFWLATEACRQFSMDRQSGALELLLSTPLSPGEIVRGQRLGLRNQFAGPIAVVLFFDVVFMMTRPKDEEWIAVWIVGMIIFLADVVTIGWLGMWLGLRCRRTSQAAALAMILVLTLPWLLFAGVCLLVENTPLRELVRQWMSRRVFNDYGPVLLYFVLSLGMDVGLGLFARRRLGTRFREAAAGTLQPRT